MTPVNRGFYLLPTIMDLKKSTEDECIHGTHSTKSWVTSWVVSKNEHVSAHMSFSRGLHMSCLEVEHWCCFSIVTLGTFWPCCWEDHKQIPVVQSKKDLCCHRKNYMFLFSRFSVHWFSGSWKWGVIWRSCKFPSIFVSITFRFQAYNFDIYSFLQKWHVDLVKHDGVQRFGV